MNISKTASKNKGLLSKMETLSRLATEFSSSARESLQTIQNKPVTPSEIDLRYLNSIVQIRLPSLEQVLAGMTSIPENSILIGAAQDGSPILMDLSDSEAGSLLILGEPGSGKTRLLLSMLASACLINSPRKVRFNCITFQLGDINWLSRKPHAYQISAPYNEKSYRIINELVDLLDQRCDGRQGGPAVILAIDGLDELMASLDNEMFNLLLWTIENGPAHRIWTVATLDAYQENLVQPEILECFGTWLGGFMSYPPSGGLVSNPRFEQRIQSPHRLIPGAQFGVMVEGEWTPFWVPSLS
jgi:Cdc6-like AAA superfamily ATPase